MYASHLTMNMDRNTVVNFPIVSWRIVRGALTSCSPDDLNAHDEHASVT